MIIAVLWLTLSYRLFPSFDSHPTDRFSTVYLKNKQGKNNKQRKQKQTNKIQNKHVTLFVISHMRNYWSVQSINLIFNYYFVLATNQQLFLNTVNCL